MEMRWRMVIVKNDDSKKSADLGHSVSSLWPRFEPIPVSNSRQEATDRSGDTDANSLTERLESRTPKRDFHYPKQKCRPDQPSTGPVERICQDAGPLCDLAGPLFRPQV